VNRRLINLVTWVMHKKREITGSVENININNVLGEFAVPKKKKGEMEKIL
jgi:hypothetical protein